jgi:hypothetical protein
MSMPDRLDLSTNARLARSLADHVDHVDRWQSGDGALDRINHEQAAIADHDRLRSRGAVITGTGRHHSDDG